MEAGSLPLDFAGQLSGYDSLAGGNPLFANLIVEGASGAVRARPGIRTWSEFPTVSPSSDPVVEMTLFGDRIIYVTDDGAGTRKVFAWASSGVAVDLSAALGNTLVAGTAAVSMAASREHCIVVGGGAPQKVSAGLSSNRLGGSPPNFIDATFITQYLVGVVNDSSGQFYWSGVGDTLIESWDTTLDFKEAEARPDSLVGCDSTARELYLFGATTTQLFIPDENEAFVPGPVLEAGCLARKSIIRRDQTMMWLDDRRRFVVSDGRALGSENILSAGMERTLEGLTTVSDCWGFRLKLGTFDGAVWTFPTEGRAFAIDTATGKWSEFRGYESGRWVGWQPRSYLYWPERKLHLVGMADGTIAELALDAYADRTNPLRWTARTSARPTSVARHVTRAQFVVRRGDADTADTFDVRWRDDGRAWTQPIRKTMGVATDVDPVVNVSPAGAPHHTREYEISSTAAAAYLLAQATEDIEPTEW